jgi:hypothetical protein
MELPPSTALGELVGHSKLENLEHAFTKVAGLCCAFFDQYTKQAVEYMKALEDRA